MTPLLAEVRELSGRPAASVDGVIEVLLAWIDEDRKAPPLKALQGMVWSSGYASGKLRGHIYPDAAEGLRRWHDAGMRLYVYSSGSVEAQQLIFGYSEAGDLRPLFNGWFDTRVGPKIAAASYAVIASRIGLPPGDIRFLSDSIPELDAAAAAGLCTIQLVRDQGLVADSRHPIARSFSEL